MKGMEYRDRSGDTELAMSLADHPDWVFQQKFDGTRVMINLETLQFSQRNGSPLKHTAATQWIPEILQELSDLELSGNANTILDCELLIHDGTLVVFDLIDPWYLSRSLRHRIAELEALPQRPGGHLRVVRTARTPEECRALIEASADREGVVAKNLDAVYEPGKRVDHVLKFKNVHTADLVVIQTSEEPLSARLGAYTAEGNLATITSSSLIGKEKGGAIQPGDVVEVSYLYWTGTGIVQPRIMRRRDDKAATECTFDQFATYTRDAV